MGQSVVHLSDIVRDLGFLLDNNLLMTNHISSTVRSYFFHLCCLENYVSNWTEKLQMQLLCHLSCHGWTTAAVLLRGMPKNKLLRSQQVQNTATRIVTQTNRSDHITPILRELHWLHVEMRIDYKTLFLVYRCMSGTAPYYLRELIPLYLLVRQLRSSTQSRLRIPSVG